MYAGIDRVSLQRVARRVRNGDVVAYPTEYCFGIGCDPDNVAAVRRILKLKRRSRDLGLILIASDIRQLQPYVWFADPAMRARVEATWPGPVTWLLPARSRASVWLRGRHPMLAVRVTAHPVAARLCRYAGMPLVSTSANRHGRPELRDARRVRAELPGVDEVAPGWVGDLSHPTEIRDARNGKRIR